MIQPPAPAASAATAHADTAPVHRAPRNPPCATREAPSGVKVKASGTRKAGIAYLHACHIVAMTRPPVIAEEATAASAVGGDTSERTA